LRKTFQHILIALAIALAAGFLAYQWTEATHNSDIHRRLCVARELLAGGEPYAACNQEYRGHPIAEYPLTTIIALIPLSFLSDNLGASVFWAISNFVLAWAILKNGERRHWLVFLSGAYWVAFMWQQFSVLIAAILLVPSLVPVGLLKPQTALPVMLPNLTRRRVIACAAFIALTFIVYPTWPLAWYGRSSHYDGVIPLLVLPLGPLLLLALAEWRNKDAWVLFLFSLMPQRGIFDLTPLYLLPRLPLQAVILCLLSWLPALAWIANVAREPEDGIYWLHVCVYLPLLAILLWPRVKNAWISRRRLSAAPGED
jgi:hypothetical protein